MTNRHEMQVHSDRHAPLPPLDIQHVVEAISSMWHQLEGERLFITGGTGFVGVWLLETYLEARARLGIDTSAVVLTRNPTAVAARPPHLAAPPAITLTDGVRARLRAPAGTFRVRYLAATSSR